MQGGIIMSQDENKNNSEHSPNRNADVSNTYSLSDNKPRNEQIPAIKPRKKKPVSTDGQNQNP